MLAFVSTLMALLTGKALANALRVGDTVPDLTSTDHHGNPFSLADQAKEGLTLFFFYPKALTPGCTAQACSLRDAFAELQARGVRVVGVSTDSVEKQAKFVKEHNLPYTLLADAKQEVTQAFGMRMPIGMASRGAFLAENGTIIWVDPRASTSQQAEAVLNFLNNRSEASD